ncbi:signal recognition particle receptor subunit beta-like, partial [Solanum tuberosum]|uniref:signal recognition particle receptor subunit beta-like n=1 Tax=Solanum tuberosum TaxID=4113 RepID=UPI00073A27F3
CAGIYQLRDGSAHQGTVTSMEPYVGSFILHSEEDKKGKLKPVLVVNVQGHSRLRPKLDEILPQAAGVVFVVDSVEFLPNCRPASEYLYAILTKASVVKKKVPVLLLCNKVTAHTTEFIRKQLEKDAELPSEELKFTSPRWNTVLHALFSFCYKLRTSRTVVSDAHISNEYTLGVPGEPFAFSQCHNRVIVAEASGLTGEISQLEKFIRENVKP